MTYNARTDTGRCSGTGVSFVMTSGPFQCIHGF